MNVTHRKLEAFASSLVASKIITADQLKVAEISQKNLGSPLFQVLLKKGFVSEKILIRFLAQKLGLASISLEIRAFPINPSRTQSGCSSRHGQDSPGMCGAMAGHRFASPMDWATTLRMAKSCLPLPPHLLTH